ncbi:PhnB protein [Minicystis rosea]|nr:PhnB protein [Minicystis rosea]
MIPEREAAARGLSSFRALVPSAFFHRKRMSAASPAGLPAGRGEKRSTAVSISRTFVRRPDEARFEPGRERPDPLDPTYRGETTMRFMILIKADKNSEAGVMPDEKLLTEMGKYNEELVKAGVMLAGEGLHPSSKGARVRFSGTSRTVIDGPFAETKELIAGFWLWQVKSKEEAIEWVKRCPNPMLGESEIEIRQVFDPADFGEAMTPELQAQEDRLRAELSKK